MTDRTSLKLPAERKRLFDRASEIVANGPADDPPRGDLIDAALTHLIESHENIDEARGEYSAHEIKELANTSVIGLNYRTSIERKWR
jgi:hypothetical protein